jgi:hypothetical protein
MNTDCPLLMEFPLNSHCVLSVGEPVARQRNTTVLPSVEFWSVGAVSISGGSVHIEDNCFFQQQQRPEF